jgi:hypothetical protein
MRVFVLGFMRLPPLVSTLQHGFDMADILHQGPDLLAGRHQSENVPKPATSQQVESDEIERGPSQDDLDMECLGEAPG